VRNAALYPQGFQWGRRCQTPLEGEKDPRRPSATASGGRAGRITRPKQVSTPGFRHHVEGNQYGDERGQNASEILNRLGSELDQMCFHRDGHRWLRIMRTKRVSKLGVMANAGACRPFLRECGTNEN